MERTAIPLVVLAGGDQQPAHLPSAAVGVHPLSGSKGLRLKVGGQPLVDLVLDRFRDTGAFGPLFVAGPASSYGSRRGDARVIDTDGTFGENIRAAAAVVAREHPGKPIAFTTCDIVPKPEELHRVLADYHRHGPLDFWFPLVLAPEPEQLGASAWKPRYRVIPEEGAEPRACLPGHLIVVDPEALRLPLVYRAFDLAYRSRNRSVLYRLSLILFHVVADLLYQDLRHLLGARLPTVTWTVVVNGILLALHLRKGRVSEEEMATRLHRIFVKHRHRKRHPSRKGRLHVMEALSLARDIDTREEAAELTGRQP